MTRKGRFLVVFTILIICMVSIGIIGMKNVNASWDDETWISDFTDEQKDEMKNQSIDLVLQPGTFTFNNVNKESIIKVKSEIAGYYNIYIREVDSDDDSWERIENYYDWDVNSFSVNIYREDEDGELPCVTTNRNYIGDYPYRGTYFSKDTVYYIRPTFSDSLDIEIMFEKNGLTEKYALAPNVNEGSNSVTITSSADSDTYDNYYIKFTPKETKIYTIQYLINNGENKNREVNYVCQINEDICRKYYLSCGVNHQYKLIKGNSYYLKIEGLYKQGENIIDISILEYELPESAKNAKQIYCNEYINQTLEGEKCYDTYYKLSVPKTGYYYYGMITDTWNKIPLGIYDENLFMINMYDSITNTAFYLEAGKDYYVLLYCTTGTKIVFKEYNIDEIFSRFCEIKANQEQEIPEDIDEYNSFRMKFDCDKTGEYTLDTNAVSESYDHPCIAVYDSDYNIITGFDACEEIKMNFVEGETYYIVCSLLGMYDKMDSLKVILKSKDWIDDSTSTDTPSKPNDNKPSSDDTPDAPDKSSKPEKIGTKLSSRKAKYTVIGKRQISYDAPIKKVATSVVIPDTVTIKGVKYKVTAIKANAFKNYKKLKKIVIGKNIKKIGKNAFYGCKNLKTVTIKTTGLSSKTVGKNAFAKINKKAKIKVPKKRLKAYKRLLKAKGIKYKTQKITK